MLTAFNHATGLPLAQPQFRRGLGLTAGRGRREVEFTPELRALVERSLEELRGLLDSQCVPPAVFKPACEECSSFEICLPKAAGEDRRAARLARQLFQI
jgi:hypothetical protein